MRPAASPRLFALPARRGWFPLLLPLLMLLAVVVILWREAAPQAELNFPLAWLRGSPAGAGSTPPDTPALLNQAFAAWGGLQPELRLMLGLRDKLGGGGPFALPGPLLLQQAGPAAEALLQHSAPATTVAQAKE